MGREEGKEQKKKKERRRKRKRKKIRSNPSAHLPVIKTYNSREPSAKPCPRPLSYLSSSFPPSFPARTSQERVFIFIFALHLAPYALLHISYFVPQLLYRASMDFGPLPFPPWRMREGRGEYLSSCQHRGPNTNVHPGGRRKRFEFRNRGNRRRGYFLLFFSFLNIFEDKDEAKREEIFANDQFVSLKFLRYIEAIRIQKRNQKFARGGGNLISKV